MIDLATLKQEIENNTFSNDLIISICKDDSSIFVAKQYIHFISNKNDLDIQNIDSEGDVASDPFSNFSSTIFVYSVDTLNRVPRISGSKLWIICNKTSKSIENDYSDNIVKIPKLENWQIKDYVATTCKITDEEAEELISTYRDLIKLDIEIRKLSIFRENMYEELKDQLFYLEEGSLFELVNSLIQRDKEKLSEASKNIENIEPFGFMALLKKNLKLVIDVQLAKNPTAESVGVSGKQFWAINKYSCNHYTRDELLYLFDFITQIDSQIKSGELDTSHVVNYIISRFLNFMR